MARRYSRDNRGRFAASGSGATARGGRLKTASGKRRETQTANLKGGIAGTVGRKGDRKAAPAKAKPTSSMGQPLGGTRGTAKAKSMASRSGVTKPPVTTAGLMKQGGSRWQKNGMDRIYFNNAGEKAGLKIDRFKSGSVSSATLKGKPLSNSKAGEIAGNLRETKVFFDRKSRKMNVQDPGNSVGRKAQGETASSLARSGAKKIMNASRLPIKRARKRRAS